MTEREPTTPDPRDAAAEHVELLPGTGLGGVGEEGEVDVRHVPMLRRVKVSGPVRAAARLRVGAIVTDAAPGSVAVRAGSPRPASSANDDVARAARAARRAGPGRGTRPSPSPRVAATFSGVPSAMIRPPRSPPSGPEVDDPVGRLDDVEVVLDDEDGVAAVDEPMEDLEQLLDVGEVEARSSARRGRTGSDRSLAATAPSRASPAAPRRPTGSSPAGRGGRSRGPTS